MGPATVGLKGLELFWAEQALASTTATTAPTMRYPNFCMVFPGQKARTDLLRYEYFG